MTEERQTPKSLEGRRPRNGEFRVLEESSRTMWTLKSSGIMLEELKKVRASLQIKPLITEGERSTTSTKNCNLRGPERDSQMIRDSKLGVFWEVGGKRV